LLTSLSKLKSKSKDNKTYKRQDKRKESKNLESLKEISSLLLQLQNLVLRLSLLNFRLFKIINTTRLHTSITKIARIFSKTITIFILANKKNNAKNYLYVKININLQYRINYCFAILIKVFQLIKLAISTKKQEENLITIILKSIVYITY